MTTQVENSPASQTDANTLLDLVTRALGSAAPPLDNPNLVITAVCADSRDVTPGAMFVAICGTKEDGARYIADAVRRGAAVVVADRSAADLIADDPSPAVLLRVPNARQALARMAAAWSGLDRLQARGQLKAIGITGTNGKTTVSYMARSVLRTRGSPVALLGTIEYDLVDRTVAAPLTTPDPVTLASSLVDAHDAGARAAVMEVSSHSLAQHRTDGIRFDVAVFTNLTQDHLDYHGDRNAYLAAKRRLFEGLDPAACAVVNADDPARAEIVAGCRARIIEFGIGRANLQATDIRSNRRGSRFVLCWEGRRAEVYTPMVGRHNVSNALAAAAIGLASGLDLSSVVEGIQGLRQVRGRLQRVTDDGHDFDVFVDYAHTDDALRNVLSATRQVTRGRLWCVFGCGGDRDRTKRPLMARAVSENADAFVVTSDNPRSEDPDAIIEDILRGLDPPQRSRAEVRPDRADAIRSAVDRLATGDTLIVAGKGHEDYQIIDDRRIHFDDVDCVRDALARRRKSET